LYVFVQAANWAETMAAIPREQSDTIGVQNPEVPAPLYGMIEKCLEKKPEKRYVFMWAGIAGAR
jgi:hypothetical protein